MWACPYPTDAHPIRLYVLKPLPLDVGLCQPTVKLSFLGWRQLPLFFQGVWRCRPDCSKFMTFVPELVSRQVRRQPFWPQQRVRHRLPRS